MPYFLQDNTVSDLNAFYKLHKEITENIDTMPKKYYTRDSVFLYRSRFQDTVRYKHKFFDTNKFKYKRDTKYFKPFIKQSYPVTRKEPITIVELNEADSIQLSKVKFIGSISAGKIIKLRNKLRGFHSVWQLYYILGADSSRIQRIIPYLTVDPTLVRKFNLNTLDKDSVRGNRTFSFKDVERWKNYKKHHGPYKRVDDLLKFNLVDDSTFKMVAPYLEVK